MESKTTRHSLENSYSKHMFLDAERFQVGHAALSKSPNQRGFVSLVGAGPGDPDLLTVKALKALQRCDMVVYDRLVSQEILDLIPASAEKIYVGKRCGEPSLKQAEINQILLQFAKQGRQIVRLKGGDPFIFGR